MIELSPKREIIIFSTEFLDLNSWCMFLKPKYPIPKAKEIEQKKFKIKD